jgi:hypothetical protein
VGALAEGIRNFTRRGGAEDSDVVAFWCVSGFDSVEAMVGASGSVVILLGLAGEGEGLGRFASGDGTGEGAGWVAWRVCGGVEGRSEVIGEFWSRRISVVVLDRGIVGGDAISENAFERAASALI